MLACLESTMEWTEPDGISRPAFPGCLCLLCHDAGFGHTVCEVAVHLDGITTAATIGVKPVVTCKYNSLLLIIVCSWRMYILIAATTEQYNIISSNHFQPYHPQGEGLGSFSLGIPVIQEASSTHPSSCGVLGSCLLDPGQPLLHRHGRKWSRTQEQEAMAQQPMRRRGRRSLEVYRDRDIQEQAIFCTHLFQLYTLKRTGGPLGPCRKMEKKKNIHL